MTATEQDKAEELEALAQLVRELLPEHAVFVVHSPDMEITSRAHYATGTQIWTLKPVDRKK